MIFNVAVDPVIVPERIVPTPQIAAAKAPAKEAGGKGSSAKAGSARPPQGNGGTRPATGDGSFGNAIIAAAFKRAAKKYSNAFRRLTD